MSAREGINAGSLSGVASGLRRLQPALQVIQNIGVRSTSDPALLPYGGGRAQSQEEHSMHSFAPPSRWPLPTREPIEQIRRSSAPEPGEALIVRKAV